MLLPKHMKELSDAIETNPGTKQYVKITFHGEPVACRRDTVREMLLLDLTNLHNYANKQPKDIIAYLQVLGYKKSLIKNLIKPDLTEELFNLMVTKQGYRYEMCAWDTLFHPSLVETYNDFKHNSILVLPYSVFNIKPDAVASVDKELIYELIHYTPEYKRPFYHFKNIILHHICKDLDLHEYPTSVDLTQFIRVLYGTNISQVLELNRQFLIVTSHMKDMKSVKVHVSPFSRMLLETYFNIKLTSKYPKKQIVIDCNAFVV